jgi:hypothetical protein
MLVEFDSSVSDEIRQEFFRTARTKTRARYTALVAFIFAAALVIGTYINSTVPGDFHITMSPDGPVVAPHNGQYM